jgi:hypothetical protein
MRVNSSVPPQHHPPFTQTTHISGVVQDLVQKLHRASRRGLGHFVAKIQHKALRAGRAHMYGGSITKESKCETPSAYIYIYMYSKVSTNKAVKAHLELNCRAKLPSSSRRMIFSQQQHLPASHEPHASLLYSQLAQLLHATSHSFCTAVVTSSGHVTASIRARLKQRLMTSPAQAEADDEPGSRRG